MKKSGILTLILLLVVAVIILFFIHSPKIENEIVVESKSEKAIKSLGKILEDNYFNDVKIDKERLSLKVNGEYEVYLKNNYYLMNIKNKESDAYCKIVDSIEMSLGVLKGASIETCKMTLEGKINLGSINAEIYKDHTILTVSIKEKAILYDESHSHSEKELISLDKINYTINIDDFIFSSINSSFTDKAQTICGNVYGEKNQIFLIKIYDESRVSLTQEKYVYLNDTEKFVPFCVEFKTNSKKAKYFSIEVE